MALGLHCHFVTSPHFGTALSEVPGRCQFFLWEGADQYGVIVPLLDEDFRSELGGGADGITFTASAGSVGRARQAVALAVSVIREDPYQAIADGLRLAVARMGRGRLREDKAAPNWIDLLGWCTWDAFYEKVSEENVLAGLAQFKDGGIVPGHVIVDEGWQDYDETHFLRGYGADKGKFTEGKLQELVQRAKEDFGVRMVGCWRTLFGELRGVDVEAEALAPLKRRLVPEPDTEDALFGVVDPKDVARFHDDYAERMAASGIDFVKVDFQSALHLMTHDHIGRAEGARLWQDGLQASVNRHFGGEILNCMAMGSDQVYHTASSNVCRSSDDFFPAKDDSHPVHLKQNAYNSLWLGQMQWPDWDMFQSGHAWGLYHATARAVSGGPVYVSDKPGTSDYALLKRLVAADGKTLRCSQPALPTRAMLFSDPLEMSDLLRVFNRSAGIGLMGLFHPGVEAQPESIRAAVSASEIEGFDANRLFAVHSSVRGYLGTRSGSDEVEVELASRGAEILTFSPVVDDFAPLGLIDKLNPSPAVVASTARNGSLFLDIRGGGRFGIYAMRKVERVLLNDASVDFVQAVNGLVSFDTGGLANARVEVRTTSESKSEGGC